MPWSKASTSLPRRSPTATPLSSNGLRQVSQELVTAQKQHSTPPDEQLAKAARHQDLVRLEAPDDAVVLKLAKLSVGSVLKEGDPFITLAPLRSPVEAEVHIACTRRRFLPPWRQSHPEARPVQFRRARDGFGYVALDQ